VETTTVRLQSVVEGSLSLAACYSKGEHQSYSKGDIKVCIGIKQPSLPKSEEGLHAAVRENIKAIVGENIKAIVRENNKVCIGIKQPRFQSQKKACMLQQGRTSKLQ